VDGISRIFKDGWAIKKLDKEEITVKTKWF